MEHSSDTSTKTKNSSFKRGDKVTFIANGTKHEGNVALLVYPMVKSVKLYSAPYNNNAPETEVGAWVSYDRRIENCKYEVQEKQDAELYLYHIPLSHLHLGKETELEDQKYPDPIGDADEINNQEIDVKENNSECLPDLQPSSCPSLELEDPETSSQSIEDGARNSIEDNSNQEDSQESENMDRNKEGLRKRNKVDKNGNFPPEREENSGPGTSRSTREPNAPKHVPRKETVLYSTYYLRSHNQEKTCNKYLKNPNSEMELIVDSQIACALTYAETISHREILIADDPDFSLASEIDSIDNSLKNFENPLSLLTAKQREDLNADFAGLHASIVSILNDPKRFKGRIEEITKQLKSKRNILSTCKKNLSVIKESKQATSWLSKLEVEASEIKKPPYAATAELYDAISKWTEIETELTEHLPQFIVLADCVGYLKSVKANITSSSVIASGESILELHASLSQHAKAQTAKLRLSRNQIRKFESDEQGLLKDIINLRTRVGDCPNDSYKILNEIEEKLQLIANEYEHLIHFKHQIEDDTSKMDTTFIPEYESLKGEFTSKKNTMEKLANMMIEKQQFSEEYNTLLVYAKKFLCVPNTENIDNVESEIKKAEGLKESVFNMLGKYDELKQMTGEIPNFTSLIDRNALVLLQPNLNKRIEKCHAVKSAFTQRNELEDIQHILAIVDSIAINDIIKSTNALSKLTDALQSLNEIEPRIGSLHAKVLKSSIEYKQVKSIQDLYEETFKTRAKFQEIQKRVQYLLGMVKTNGAQIIEPVDEVGQDVTQGGHYSPSILVSHGEQQNNYLTNRRDSVKDEKSDKPEQANVTSGKHSYAEAAKGSNNSISTEVPQKSFYSSILPSFSFFGKRNDTIPIKKEKDAEDNPQHNKVSADQKNQKKFGCKDSDEELQDASECAAVSIVQGLRIGAMVGLRRKIKGDPAEGCGEIKCIVRANNDIMIGIEFDSPIGNFDGVYKSITLFKCPEKHGMLVPLKDFLKAERGFVLFLGGEKEITNEAPQTTEDAINKDILEEPISLKTLKCDNISKFKGLQGKKNSCYIDTALFSMFAFAKNFDFILEKSENDEEANLSRKIKEILKKDIVNPLRKNRTSSPQGVTNLRKAMKDLSPKLEQSYMDAEEFLIILFEDALHLNNFIEFEETGDFLHQIFLEPGTIKEPQAFTTTQMLFESSFCVCDILFKKVPHPAFIMEMPRSDGQLKYCDRILPCRSLDITDLMQKAPRKCCICGATAYYQCKRCFGLLGDQQGIKSTYFCTTCNDKIHRHTSRVGHEVQRVEEISSTNLSEEKLNLLAVLCIRSNHYVCFVRCEQGDMKEWVYFDSDPGGGNAKAEILEGFEEQMITLEKSQNLSLSDWNNMNPMMKRMLTDIYICIYVKPEVQEDEDL